MEPEGLIGDDFAGEGEEEKRHEKRAVFCVGFM